MGGECKPGCFLRDSWAGQERQAAWDTGEQRSLAMAVHHLRSPNPVWHGARRRRYTCTVAMRLGGRRAFPEDCPDVVSENRREGEGECTACGDGALAHMDL